jgi:LAO/AO transport system kinase
MDSIADNDGLFIRSVPSGPCHDGLCHNVVGLLASLESGGFSDIILETVGVGQVSYEVRRLVDTLVLVLVPESGDTVQAMKAGILELADIYVINKADRAGSSRLATELGAILRRRVNTGQESPPVILTSTLDDRGIDELDRAITAHQNTPLIEEQRSIVLLERRRYQLRALLQQRFDELTAEGVICADESLWESFNAFVSRLAPER